MNTKNPKRAEERITAVIDAWSDLRATKSFQDLTLDEFKAALQPSFATRRAVAQAENNLSAAIVQRNEADAVSLALVQQVVDAVIGDKSEGRNGELYKAMGYVRSSERASGLTRASRNGATQTEVAKAA